MTRKNRSTRTVTIIWYVLMITLALSGLIGLALALTPYPALKAFLDSLAKDGNFERFSQPFYTTIQIPSFIAGALLLAVCGFAALRPGQTQTWIAACISFVRRFAGRLPGDFQRLLAAIRGAKPPAWELWILLALIAFGLAARLLNIERGMGYDESYTYMEFARHPLRQVISDYHLPNNHIFHTVLVHFSTLVFGNAHWAIRLPALIAGLLIIPAVYLLGRQLYRPWIGLAAAGIVAAAPVMVSYSVNARGYTLITLFTLLLLILADAVRKEKNLAAWVLMILITGLGFYTVPTMLYPFGIVFTFLALSVPLAAIDARYGGWKGWLRYLVAYGFGSALVSIFLYLPVFRVKGFLTVFGNDPIVRSLSLHEFFLNLPHRLADIQADWLWGGLPDWLAPVFLFCAALSIILHKQVSRGGVNIVLAAALFVLPAVLIQRPILLARVWVFLFPLLVLAGVAGFSALIGVIAWKKPLRSNLQNAAAALALAAALLSGGRFMVSSWNHYDSIHYATSDGAALVTQHMREILRDGDVVVITPAYDSRFWFYFDFFKIPQRHIRDIKSQHFTRVLVIVASYQEGTLEELILSYGPDLGFMRMDTAQAIYQAAEFTVYEVYPYQDVVDRAYGLAPDSE